MTTASLTFFEGCGAIVPTDAGAAVFAGGAQHRARYEAQSRLVADALRAGGVAVEYERFDDERARLRGSASIIRVSEAVERFIARIVASTTGRDAPLRAGAAR